MQTILMEKWAKKFRALVVALIFSGALNIGLFTALIVFSLEKHSPSQKEEVSNLQLLFLRG